MRDEVMDVVRAPFRPEFLNRVDEIILFHRLRRQDMGKIVDIQLKRLEKLLADRKIVLDLDEEALRLAGRQGLRPGLWRAAAEAGDPEGAAGPARREDPARATSATARLVKITNGSDRLNFRAKPAVVETDEAA